jgi:hypothetical protein
MVTTSLNEGSSDKPLQVRVITATLHCQYSSLPSLFTVFVEAKRNNKAMIAHEKALEWQELFDLALLDEDVDEEDIVAMGYRVAGA